MKHSCSNRGSLQLLLTLVITSTCYLVTLSQNVGIGSSSFTPDADAMLEIQSTTSGLLIPRMTEAQRIAVGPTTNNDYGLLVYQTNNDSGFYYWNGAAWLHMVDQKTGWLTEGNDGINGGTHFLGTKDNVSLRFRTNNVPQMVLDSNGRLGIGVSAPTYQLDVQRTDHPAVLRLKTTDATSETRADVANNAGIGFRISAYGSAYAGVSTLNVGANGGSIQKTGNGIFALSTQNAYPLIFGTQDTERMRIDATGNVGIGTSNPTEKLTVGDGSEDMTGILVEGLSPVASAHEFDLNSFLHLKCEEFNSQVGLIFEQYDTSLANYDLGGIVYSNINVNQGMNFYLGRGPLGNYVFHRRNSGTEAIEEIIRFTRDGDVGIGTSSPSMKLHVDGDANSALFQNSGGHSFAYVRSGSANISAVIFGDVTPANRWSVGNDGADGLMLRQGDANGTGPYAFYSDNAINVGINTSSPAGRFHISNNTGVGNDSSLIFTTGNGFLGLGTSSPTRKLHIEGASSSRASIHLNNTGTPFNSSIIEFASEGTITSLIEAASTNSSEGNLRFYTASTGTTAERVRIDSAGRVGVGTTTPAGLLHISSGDDGDANLIIEADDDNSNDADNPSIFFRQDGGQQIGFLGLNGSADARATGAAGNAFLIGSETSNIVPVQFVTSDSVRMTISNEGDVGIGISAPSALLDVRDSINGYVARFRSTGSGDNHGLYIRVNEDASGTALDNYVTLHSTGTGAGGFTWASGNSERMRMTAGGRLGIGTNNPQRTLHVNDVMRLEPRGTAPSSPSAGDMYIDSSDSNKLKVYDGSTWQSAW